MKVESGGGVWRWGEWRWGEWRWESRDGVGCVGGECGGESTWRRECGGGRVEVGSVEVGEWR